MYGQKKSKENNPQEPNDFKFAFYTDKVSHNFKRGENFIVITKLRIKFKLDSRILCKF